MATPMYYSGHTGMPANMHHPSHGRMSSNNLQGLSLLAVPSHPGRPRSTMSSPSDVDHMTTPIYAYPSGFISNSAAGVSHRPTGHGVDTISESTTHDHNVGSLPLDMYSAQHEEPWNPMRVTYSSNAGAERTSFSGPDARFGQYRQQAISDIDESVAGPRSDSGYFTHPAPQSVISNEPDRAEQELSSDMFRMRNLNVSSAPSESTEYVPPPSDQASQYSGRSMNQSKNTYTCSKCPEVSKCPSDHKYVPINIVHTILLILRFQETYAQT